MKPIIETLYYLVRDNLIERNTIFNLSILFLLVSILEALSVAALVPILGSLVSGESFDILSFELSLLQVILCASFIMLLKFVVVLVSQNEIIKAIQYVQLKIRIRLAENFIDDKIESFNFLDKITRQSTQITDVLLLSGLRVISDLLICLSLVSLLIKTDVLLFITISFISISIASLYWLIVKPKLMTAGITVSSKMAELIEVSEDFKELRSEIKQLNVKDYFISYLKRCSKSLIDSQRTNQFLSIVPKYIVELIVFICLCVMSLYYQGVGDSLNLLLTFGFVFIRLMPIATSIFTNLSRIRFSYSTTKDLRNTLHTSFVDNKLCQSKETDFMPSNIMLDTDNYNGLVGIIGKSGSGKTTLLINTNNKLSVLNSTEKYRSLIMPQRTLLFASSLYDNIVLGREENKLKFQELISYFGLNHLENRKNIKKECSGGEAQRIIICRYLYVYPEILFLDEATSALDAKNKANVLVKLKELIDHKHIEKIFMITHDLNSQQFFDTTIEVENFNVR